MKKVLFVAFVIVAMFASTAAAPMPSSVTLVGVSNSGGGPMFTFHVDGPVNLYNGIVHSVEGEYQGDFPLSCKQEDENTVICHTSKKVSGDWVTVEFGGSKFWVQVPDKGEPVIEVCAPRPTIITRSQQSDPCQPTNARIKSATYNSLRYAYNGKYIAQ